MSAYWFLLLFAFSSLFTWLIYVLFRSHTIWPKRCDANSWIADSPDLNCDDIPFTNFEAHWPDPHHLDADGTGMGALVCLYGSCGINAIVKDFITPNLLESCSPN